MDRTPNDRDRFRARPRHRVRPGRPRALRKGDRLVFGIFAALAEFERELVNAPWQGSTREARVNGILVQLPEV